MITIEVIKACLEEAGITPLTDVAEEKLGSSSSSRPGNSGRKWLHYYTDKSVRHHWMFTLGMNANGSDGGDSSVLSVYYEGPDYSFRQQYRYELSDPRVFNTIATHIALGPQHHPGLVCDRPGARLYLWRERQRIKRA